MKYFYSKLAKTLFLVFLCIIVPFIGSSQTQPYYESFTKNAFPAGWSNSTTVSNTSWKVVAGINAIEGVTGSALTFEKDFSEDKGKTSNEFKNENIWAFTSAIRMSAGTNVVRFMQKNISNGGEATFKLALNTVQNYSGATIVATETYTTSPTWKEYIYTVNVSAAGNYYLGFGITGLKEAANIGIDELKVGPSGGQFYNKKGADLTLLSNWSENTDGTGQQPVNFTNDNQTFIIHNYDLYTITMPMLPFYYLKIGA